MCTHEVGKINKKIKIKDINAKIKREKVDKAL
jgi:hypothetical protein